ncbi:MAG TPA: FtsX-like permease family protein [Wenzhouxiangella sp.]|nr:FtsX-like permease family protein [Wenzhouxiangella sp.]
MTGLSFKLLVRQWRSGALMMLFAGLVLASGALSAVGLFADRVGASLQRQAGEILAADLAIGGRQRLPEAYRLKARQLGLETAEIARLSTMLFMGEESHLIDLKAVTDRYPLRGTLGLAGQLDGEQQAVAASPRPGHGWMADRGLQLFQADTGVTVDVGWKKVKLDRVLMREPDIGGSRFMLAPRLIIHMDDLLESELLGPGARVRWRLLVAGDSRNVEEFRQWADARLDSGEDIITVSDAQADTGRTLDQAQRFLGMAALTAVILAAVAVLLAALRYAATQRNLVALGKVFGAQNRQILTALTLLLLWLVLTASLVGGALGFAAQHAIASALAEGASGALPPPGWGPLLTSAGFTLLLACGFALPPLVNLRSVPPMRILNKSLPAASGWRKGLWLLPLLTAVALPTLRLGDMRLAGLVLGASATLAAVLALAAWLAMLLCRVLARRAPGKWRFGLSGLDRRRGAGIVQITALGLGLMALLLLAMVGNELLEQWRASLPDNAADHFIVNIQPGQRSAIENRLNELGMLDLQVRPMANVNLVEINGAPAPDEHWAGQVNVSWTDRLPPGNTIVEGRFHGSGNNNHQISLARSWARRSGIKMGDTLAFTSGGQRIEARVTSIRDVEWETFSVNFFILLSPSAGRDLPHQFIASFRQPAQAYSTRELQQAWPNISIVDIGSLLDRIGEMIDRVARAAQVVFMFTLAAGLIVLLAALESTLDERRYEVALIRTLGAGRGMVWRSLLIEYGTMALMTAGLATGGAALTGWLVARELFEFSYRPSLAIMVGGLLASVVLVVGSGWLGNRRAVGGAPLRELQRRRD